MAELEVDIVDGANDATLFNEAVTEKPEVQPRDDAGRFAPIKQAEPEPKPEPEQAKPVETPQAPPVEDDRHNIPAWRLKEEAESKREWKEKAEKAEAERQRFERQFHETQQRLASLEKPKVQEDAPDPLLDPQGYRQSIDRQMNERLQNQQREFDLRLAHRTHGEVFEKAYQEARSAIQDGDVALSAMMQQSASPGETLVQWYKQRQVTREVGTDPNAWLEKKLEERLSDPAFLAKAMERARSQATQSPQSRPVVSLPPSLSAASSAGSQTLDPDDDNSDASVFRQAFRR